MSYFSLSYTVGPGGRLFCDLIICLIIERINYRFLASCLCLIDSRWNWNCLWMRVNNLPELQSLDNFRSNFIGDTIWLYTLGIALYVISMMNVWNQIMSWDLISVLCLDLKLISEKHSNQIQIVKYLYDFLISCRCTF